MTAPDPIADAQALDPRIERARRAIEVLLDVGMRLVATLDPAAGPAPVKDPFDAYCRVARAMRLTILLNARLAGLAAGVTVETAAVPAADEAQDEALDGPEAEACGDRPDPTEFSDRPDREAPDEIARFARRPMTELVALVCRDLELSSEQAAEVRAPFADLAANDDRHAASGAAPRTAGVPPANPPCTSPAMAHKRALLAQTAAAAPPLPLRLKLGP